ncbi:MAG: hypothetical protein GX369_00335 [Euryarchaeota archaeon]|nr:hypothetical protein [Euryarchaeota archaeon]
MDFEGLEEGLNDGWKQFISTVEGSISLNDNACELCSNFIKDGNKLFKTISAYDHILSNVAKRPNHKIENTLCLILPFLKAYNVTDMATLEFSRRNIMTIPGVRKTMRFVQEFMTPFIIATSYEHYVSAVCDAISFPIENVYCTALELDSLDIGMHEAEILKNTAREIVNLNLSYVPYSVKSMDDLSPQDLDIIQRLDEIFLEELTDLSSYSLISDVNPLGNEEKASVILDSRRRSGISLEDTCYVGSSMTDVNSFQLVRDGHGLTISFNGDEYALEEAEFALISENTVAISVLTEVFHKRGLDGVNDLAEDWTMRGLREMSTVNPYLLKEFERTFSSNMPVLTKVSKDNIETLARQGTIALNSIRCNHMNSLS